jgi:hypothetical protein
MSGLKVLGAVTAASQLAEQVLGILKLIQSVRDAPEDVISHVSSLQGPAKVAQSARTTSSYQSPQVAGILDLINNKVEVVSRTLNGLAVTSSDNKPSILKEALITARKDGIIINKLDQIERDKMTLALYLSGIDA